MRVHLYRLSLLFLVATGAGAVWLWHVQEQSMDTELVLPDEAVLYTIEPGTGFTQVVKDLHGRGFLEHPYALAWHARWTGVASTIKAGEYRLLPGMTPRDVLALFVSGRVVQRSFTIVEGWTFAQTMTALQAHDGLVHTLSALTAAEIMVRIDAPGEAAEGRFFPETYHFPRGTTDLEFLKRAHSAMRLYLDTAWQGRALNLPLTSPDDALILASIVEKETGVAAERERIAGVFIRRLRKNMRLETDPTVIYGLGAEFDGNLRKRDLKGDTPFNTYIHRGLPPTPIAIPGAAAIDAVVHPADGNALFFVAKGDGSHHFSATYAEHQRAVAKYQKRRRGSSQAKVENVPAVNAEPSVQ